MLVGFPIRGSARRAHVGQCFACEAELELLADKRKAGRDRMVQSGWAGRGRGPGRGRVE